MHGSTAELADEGRRSDAARWVEKDAEAVDKFMENTGSVHSAVLKPKDATNTQMSMNAHDRRRQTVLPLMLVLNVSQTG